MASEPTANTQGIKFFYLRLMRRVTSLAKYPERTGLRGVFLVLTNLNSLASNRYLPSDESSLSSSSGSEMPPLVLVSVDGCSSPALSSSVTSSVAAVSLSNNPEAGSCFYSSSSYYYCFSWGASSEGSVADSVDSVGCSYYSTSSFFSSV